MDPKYFNRIVDTYGIGADEFLDLFLAQKHVCAICQCVLVLFTTAEDERAFVDHCHITGKVRGILCRTCNVAVGFLEKNPARTARAADYIAAYGSGSNREWQAFLGGLERAPRQKPSAPKEETDKWTPQQWREWRLSVRPPETVRKDRSRQAALRQNVRKMLDKTGKHRDDGE